MGEVEGKREINRLSAFPKLGRLKSGFDCSRTITAIVWNSYPLSCDRCDHLETTDCRNRWVAIFAITWKLGLGNYALSGDENIAIALIRVISGFNT